MRGVAGVVVAALALGLAGSAGAATGVRFVTAPARVVAGSTPTVVVAGPAAGRCTLSVKYADGSTEKTLLSQPLINGKATWKWTVADTTAAGRAVATAACGKSRTTKPLLIVGSLIPPKVVVVKDGFSTRSTVGGTNLSWGLVLQNTSPNADATKVYVLINFVMADNRALGTTTSSIDFIGAHSRYYLGGNVPFPGLAPIQRLEVVIQVGGHQKRQFFAPAAQAVVVEPNPYDPGYVGDVAGELVNDNPPWVFLRGGMTGVVFDSAGNVLGGGSGYANAMMPPGTRQVFKLTLGFDAIAFDKAASAMVSTQPTWATP